MRNPVKDKIASLVLKRFPQMTLARSRHRHDFDVIVRSEHIEISKKNSDRGIRIARTSAVYLRDMVNSFDYYFHSARAITVSSNKVPKRIVDFSTPRFQEIQGFPDFPVFCTGTTEPYVTAQQYIDFAELREGDTVFDLGGYSGLTAIAFSKSVGPTGKVIVLEPDPASFEAATVNFDYHRRINGIDNIVLLPFAISGQRGHIDFSAEGSMGSADASIVGHFRGSIVRVETVTLQDLVDIHELKSVDFIKMDIEGAEEGVVASSQDFFLKYAPKIIIEPHNVNGLLSEAALRRLLDGYGYRCDTILQTGVTLPLVTGTPARVPVAIGGSASDTVLQSL